MSRRKKSYNNNKRYKKGSKSMFKGVPGEAKLYANYGVGGTMTGREKRDLMGYIKTDKRKFLKTMQLRFPKFFTKSGRKKYYLSGTINAQATEFIRLEDVFPASVLFCEEGLAGTLFADANAESVNNFLQSIAMWKLEAGYKEFSSFNVVTLLSEMKHLLEIEQLALETHTDLVDMYKGFDRASMPNARFAQMFGSYPPSKDALLAKYGVPRPVFAAILKEFLQIFPHTVAIQAAGDPRAGDEEMKEDGQQQIQTGARQDPVQQPPINNWIGAYSELLREEPFPLPNLESADTNPAIVAQMYGLLGARTYSALRLRMCFYRSMKALCEVYLSQAQQLVAEGIEAPWMNEYVKQSESSIRFIQYGLQRFLDNAGFTPYVGSLDLSWQRTDRKRLIEARAGDMGRSFIPPSEVGKDNTRENYIPFDFAGTATRVNYPLLMKLHDTAMLRELFNCFQNHVTAKWQVVGSRGFVVLVFAFQAYHQQFNDDQQASTSTFQVTNTDSSVNNSLGWQKTNNSVVGQLAAQNLTEVWMDKANQTSTKESLDPRSMYQMYYKMCTGSLSGYTSRQYTPEMLISSQERLVSSKAWYKRNGYTEISSKMSLTVGPMMLDTSGVSGRPTFRPACVTIDQVQATYTNAKYTSIGRWAQATDAQLASTLSSYLNPSTLDAQGTSALTALRATQGSLSMGLQAAGRQAAQTARAQQAEPSAMAYVADEDAFKRLKSEIKLIGAIDADIYTHLHRMQSAKYLPTTIVLDYDEDSLTRLGYRNRAKKMFADSVINLTPDTATFSLALIKHLKGILDKILDAGAFKTFQEDFDGKFRNNVKQYTQLTFAERFYLAIDVVLQSGIQTDLTQEQLQILNRERATWKFLIYSMLKNARFNARFAQIEVKDISIEVQIKSIQSYLHMVIKYAELKSLVNVTVDINIPKYKIKFFEYLKNITFIYPDVDLPDDVDRCLGHGRGAGTMMSVQSKMKYESINRLAYRGFSGFSANAFSLFGGALDANQFRAGLSVEYTANLAGTNLPVGYNVIPLIPMISGYMPSSSLLTSLFAAKIPWLFLHSAASRRQSSTQKLVVGPSIISRMTNSAMKADRFSMLDAMFQMIASDTYRNTLPVINGRLYAEATYRRKLMIPGIHLLGLVSRGRTKVYGTSDETFSDYITVDPVIRGSSMRGMGLEAISFEKNTLRDPLRYAVDPESTERTVERQMFGKYIYPKTLSLTLQSRHQLRLMQIMESGTQSQLKGFQQMGIAVSAFHAWNDYLGLAGLVKPGVDQAVQRAQYDLYNGLGLHAFQFGKEQADLGLGCFSWYDTTQESMELGVINATNVFTTYRTTRSGGVTHDYGAIGHRFLAWITAQFRLKNAVEQKWRFLQSVLSTTVSYTPILRKFVRDGIFDTGQWEPQLLNQDGFGAALKADEALPENIPSAYNTSEYMDWKSAEVELAHKAMTLASWGLSPRLQRFALMSDLTDKRNTQWAGLLMYNVPAKASVGSQKIKEAMQKAYEVATEKKVGLMDLWKMLETDSQSFLDQWVQRQQTATEFALVSQWDSQFGGPALTDPTFRSRRDRGQESWTASEQNTKNQYTVRSQMLMQINSFKKFVSELTRIQKIYKRHAFWMDCYMQTFISAGDQNTVTTQRDINPWDQPYKGQGFMSTGIWRWWSWNVGPIASAANTLSWLGVQTPGTLPYFPSAQLPEALDYAIWAYTQQYLVGGHDINSTLTSNTQAYSQFDHVSRQMRDMYDYGFIMNAEKRAAWIAQNGQILDSAFEGTPLTNGALYNGAGLSEGVSDPSGVIYNTDINAYLLPSMVATETLQARYIQYMSYNWRVTVSPSDLWAMGGTKGKMTYDAIDSQSRDTGINMETQEIKYNAQVLTMPPYLLNDWLTSSATAKKDFLSQPQTYQKAIPTTMIERTIWSTIAEVILADGSTLRNDMGQNWGGSQSMYTAWKAFRKLWTQFEIMFKQYHTILEMYVQVGYQKVTDYSIYTLLQYMRRYIKNFIWAMYVIFSGIEENYNQPLTFNSQYTKATSQSTGSVLEFNKSGYDFLKRWNVQVAGETQNNRQENDAKDILPRFQALVGVTTMRDVEAQDNMDFQAQSILQQQREQNRDFESTLYQNQTRMNTEQYKKELEKYERNVRKLGPWPRLYQVLAEAVPLYRTKRDQWDRDEEQLPSDIGKQIQNIARKIRREMAVYTKNPIPGVAQSANTAASLNQSAQKSKSFSRKEVVKNVAESLMAQTGTRVANKRTQAAYIGNAGLLQGSRQQNPTSFIDTSALQNNESMQSGVDEQFYQDDQNVSFAPEQSMAQDTGQRRTRQQTSRQRNATQGQIDLSQLIGRDNNMGD